MFDDNKIPADEKACLRPYQAAKSASANLWGNLVTNLTIGLNLLQSEQVCRLLTIDDIDLTLPGQRPCAYFCQFPDSHDTFKFVVALFFSMLFINLVDFADSQDDGKLPVPVNFLMDECASIGIIPDFDRKLATIRKRDMAVAMIWQNVGQLYQNYGDRWETIMANCDTFLSLGINDSQTADMISKRIGDTTVQVETQQHESASKIMSAMNRWSSGEGRRSLMSYDELFKVGRDECIIIFRGHNPVHALKHPHKLHPDAKYMANGTSATRHLLRKQNSANGSALKKKCSLPPMSGSTPSRILTVLTQENSVLRGATLTMRRTKIAPAKRLLRHGHLSVQRQVSSLKSSSFAWSSSRIRR